MDLLNSIDFIGLITLGSSLISLIVAICLTIIILVSPSGTEEMKKISKAIQQGSIAFLTVEYIALTAFVIIMFILITVFIEWRTGICYLVGAILSAISGAIGMLISTYSNVRTAVAAEKSIYNALRIAFNSGSVMVILFFPYFLKKNRDYL